jgi:hypothetical protein
MNGHTHNKHNRPVSEEEVEAALNATLRDQGLLFPRTTEDIANIEAEVDLAEVPTPDSDAFRNILRQHAEHKTVSMTGQPSAFAVEIAENLAMAARNGGEIPEEIRKKMAADRQAAEGERTPSPDATR